MRSPGVPGGSASGVPSSSPSPERARLFVALELPAEARAALVTWGRARLSPLPGVRVVAPESLHVTLCFLGWRDLAEVGEIAAACREAAAPLPAPALRLAAALWLPPRRPRVVAVEVADRRDGALAALQSAVSGALVAGGFYEPERRPFLGHVTVGRVGRREGRIRAVDLPSPSPVQFVAPSVTLFRSRLERGGARYEPLDTVTLSEE